MSKDLTRYMTPAISDNKKKQETMDDMDFLPETEDIKELCAAATPKTFRKLLHIALHAEKDSDALKAIEQIHDRAHGRPSQTIENVISLEQIDRTIAALERRMLTKGVALEPIIDLESETVN